MTEVNLCPGCSQPNQCAFSLGQPADTCWCMQGAPDQPSTEKLPLPIKAASCYCSRCLKKLKDEKKRLEGQIDQ
ncbi:cysteine-rich CWC family protein [uncultured Endozoicomonas sp.]|uniref:cysteine-rich CWC family protein n=1 Tax=uncultured Endozoicomonas sp. TaxID=432652 RepID=UPI0034224381